MNHTHEGECIIIIYIDSYEILAFKTVQKQEKTRNVWGILPVLQTTWVVGVRPEKLAANSKLGTPGTCRYFFLTQMDPLFEFIRGFQY